MRFIYLLTIFCLYIFDVNADAEGCYKGYCWKYCGTAGFEQAFGAWYYIEDTNYIKCNTDFDCLGYASDPSPNRKKPCYGRCAAI